MQRPKHAVVCTMLIMCATMLLDSVLDQELYTLKWHELCLRTLHCTDSPDVNMLCVLLHSGSLAVH